MRPTAILLALAAALGTVRPASAQAPEWIAHAWTNGTLVRPVTVALTVRGSVVTVGGADFANTFQFADTTLTDFETYGFLMQHSPLGIREWVRSGTVVATPGADVAFLVAADSQGGVVVGEGCEFIDGVDMLTNGAIAVSRYDALGELQNSVRLSPETDCWTNPAFIVGLATDPDGNAYFTGEFRDAFTVGGTQITAEGRDVFIGSLDPAGDLRWLEGIGSTQTEVASGLLQDPRGSFDFTSSGQILMGALLGSGVTLGTGLPSETTIEMSQWVLMLFEADGAFAKVYRQSDDLSISGSAALGRAAADANGDIVAAWYFLPEGGPPTISVGDTTLIGTGPVGVAIVRHDETGQARWVHQLDSEGFEVVTDLHVDHRGFTFVAGRFDGTSLEVSARVLQNAEPGAVTEDGFVLVFGPTGDLLWTLHISGPGYQRANAVAVDAAGDVFVAGEFEETTSLGGTAISTGLGGTDLYLAKFSTSTVTGVISDASPADADLLTSIYPNPTDGPITIALQMARSHHATIEVFDVLGRRLATVYDGLAGPGTRLMRWRPNSALAPGVYSLTVSTSNHHIVRTFVIGR